MAITTMVHVRVDEQIKTQAAETLAIPFTPEDYAEGGILIDEIKSTGQEIL